MWTVLLVEDEVFVRESVRRIVDWQSLGFNVIGEAGNGEEALGFIEQHLPDLIICDILMPKMNGVEPLQRVRELEIGSRFIMLSCLSDFDYVRKALEYGASNYILKLSMNVQSLMDALVKVEVELSKQQASGLLIPPLRIDTPQQTDTGHREVDKLISYMKENFRSMISLRMLAEHVSMDEKYISTLFKKKTGTNVIQFLHQLRIDEARRLLEQSNMTISEIGTQVGYENDNYFIKIFKRFTALTPNSYRSRTRLRGELPSVKE